jgi:hypothetical protein
MYICNQGIDVESHLVKDALGLKFQFAFGDENLPEKRKKVNIYIHI